jgi:glycosyltransferase involved in cell wall biosynthesis
VKQVCINGRFLTQAMTGVQRYAWEMVRSLDRRLSAEPEIRGRYSFTLVTPRDCTFTASLQHIPVVPCGRLTGQAWEQWELPRHARHRLIVNLCNTAPVSAPGMVTIHDASVYAVPETYSVAFRLWYRVLLPVLGRRAQLILTVSEFSRSELVQRAGIPREKTRVVPPGADHMLRTPADCGIFARLPVEGGRYILAVGSRSPHKNLDAVVRAVSLLGSSGLPLVAAGGSNSRVFRQGPATPEHAFYSAGYVTDSELRALYEHAACFVYPSLYEGFGLPPLEAMSCGAPTVVSRAASLPEVCGDAALYCDPLDPESIAQQVRHLLDDPSQRAELRERGLARARGFTWDRSAGALLTLLEDADPS